MYNMLSHVANPIFANKNERGLQLAADVRDFFGIKMAARFNAIIFLSNTCGGNRLVLQN